MLEAKEVNFAYRRGLPVLNDIACTILGRIVKCVAELRHVDACRGQRRSRTGSACLELELTNLCNFLAHKTFLLKIDCLCCG